MGVKHRPLWLASGRGGFFLKFLQISFCVAFLFSLCCLALDPSAYPGVVIGCKSMPTATVAVVSVLSTLVPVVLALQPNIHPKQGGGGSDVSQ